MGSGGVWRSWLSELFGGTPKCFRTGNTRGMRVLPPGQWAGLAGRLPGVWGKPPSRLLPRGWLII